MKRPGTCAILGVFACLQLGMPSIKAEQPAFDRKEDVIYGRKFGTALTMDVFTPARNRNGAGVSSSSAAVSFLARSRSIRPSSAICSSRLHGLRRRPRQPASATRSPRSSRT